MSMPITGSNGTGGPVFAETLNFGNADVMMV